MSDSNKIEQQVEDLTLMLLYLTSWVEKEYGEQYRSWKGYPFEVLDELSENGYLTGSHKSKSIYFTQQGIEKAKELLETYGLRE